MKLRRGFVKEAEEYAEEFRSELNLSAIAPLSPMILSEHLCIPVLKLSELPILDQDFIHHFHGPGRDDLSATTVPNGTRRLIIHNDSHSPNRQNSNIMHEIAHVVLGHPPKPPMIGDGCRNFDKVMEREASELGFTLLVPKPATLHIVESRLTLKQASEHYGVSQSLLKYRLRKTNAHNWAKNRAKYWRN